VKIFTARNHKEKSAACEWILNYECPLRIEVSKYQKPRSLSVNNYYWGFVCTPLANHCGESAERMHEILCGEKWGWVEKEFRGTFYKKPRRTTTTNERGERDILGGEEMQKFVAFAESVCFEMDVPVVPYERVA
jgi:hypothetical protein